MISCGPVYLEISASEYTLEQLKDSTDDSLPESVKMTCIKIFGKNHPFYTKERENAIIKENNKIKDLIKEKSQKRVERRLK